MKQLWSLIKVQFSVIGGAYLKNKSKLKLVGYALLGIFVMACIFAYLWMFYDMIPVADKSMFITFLALAVFGTVLSSALIAGEGYMLKFKDFDLLMSLPIKRETILFSKMISFFLYCIVLSLLFLLPGMVIYVINQSLGLQLVLLSVIYAIPLVIIAIVMGMTLVLLIQKLPGFDRYPNMIKNIGTVLSILVGVSIGTLDSASSGILTTLSSTLKKLIFPVDYFVKAVANGNVVSGLLLIFIAGILLMLLILIFSKTFIEINMKASNGIKNKKFKLKNQKKSNTTFALFKKELKTLFGNFMYFLNSSIGTLMFIGLIVYVLITVMKLPEFNLAINTARNSTEMKNLVFFGVVLVLGNSGWMTFPAASSISLEGKRFWLIKSMPISMWQLCNAKVLVNAVLIIVPNIIILMIATYLFELNIMMVLVALLTTVIHGFSVGYIGISINLTFPKLNFNREIEVIKQSLSTIIAVFLGIGMIALHAFLALNVDFQSWIIGTLFFLLLNFLYLVIGLGYLYLFGSKRYRELSN
ncbi:MAG: putative ABC transporter permease subunit [Anaerorhabdus sp.]